MNFSLLLRFFSFTLVLFLFVYPLTVDAGEEHSTRKETVQGEITKAPSHMTEKQMNDIFGEDPYLGQTSYLQSPDGFSQRKSVK